MKNIYYESLKDKTDTIFAEKQKEFSGRLHFHRAFEIAYILNGETDYSVEDDAFTAEADQIVFVNRNYKHATYDKKTNEKYVIAVPEKLTQDISSLFEKQTLPPLLADKEFNKTLLSFFKALTENKDNMSKTTAKGYADVIFGSVATHYDMVELKYKSKNTSVIEDILSYIDNHYAEPLSLESISLNFGYNKSYFSRMFNQYIGMSLNNYINTVRYNQFEKEYKNKPEANIASLVFECGFPSLSTFYRVRELQKHINTR